MKIKKGFSKLSNLEYLDLSYNSITYISKEFYKSVNLKKLNLSNN
mgnify:CR=1 FL=1